MNIEKWVKLGEQLQKECEKGSWVPDKGVLGSALRYEIFGGHQDTKGN